MPDFVPPVPADWSTKDAQGVPYRLGVSASIPSWVPTAVIPIVTVGTAIVTATNGRAVLSFPE